MNLPRGILQWTDARDHASSNSPRWNLDALTTHHYNDAESQGRRAVDPTPEELQRAPKETKRPPSLRIATLNIIDARKSRLNAALRCMSQMNIDLGIFTETKLITDKYTKLCEGYQFVSTLADGKKGGV